MLKAITEYFRGAIHEIKNVTWPTEAETFRITKITLLFVVFSIVFFFILDFLLTNFIGILYSSLK